MVEGGCKVRLMSIILAAVGDEVTCKLHYGPVVKGFITTGSPRHVIKVGLEYKPISRQGDATSVICPECGVQWFILEGDPNCTIDDIPAAHLNAKVVGCTQDGFISLCSGISE